MIVEEHRRLYAFVEQIAEPGPDESGYARLSLTLDCIDAIGYHHRGNDADEDLIIVRVISTWKRLSELFQLVQMPKEGDWLLIELAYQPNMPFAWALSALRDYQGEPEITRLVGLWPVMPGEDPQPTAPTNSIPSRELASLVTKSSIGTRYFPVADKSALGEHRLQWEFLAIIKKFGTCPIPRVIDVGQASCTALHANRHSDADVLGFFDVGVPIWFHYRSMPKVLDVRLPATGGFVILSHWDFDHYSMAWSRMPELRHLSWYAPRQAVGPNGLRFQRSLGSNLHFIQEPEVELYPFFLQRGLGIHKVPEDRNATGYVLKLETPDGSVLLTGDVSYDNIDPKARQGLSGLVIPHHGGRSDAVPPLPVAGVGRAIVSYGNPNKYRHPNEAFLDHHSTVGWLVERTALHGGDTRGSRWL